MAFKDLREFLEHLEANGKLLRIRKRVDKDWEIAAVLRCMFEKLPSKDRKALVFQNVEGFDIPVVGGILGGSDEIYAMALGTTLAGVEEKWLNALQRPVPPVLVAAGPCKENILRGDEVDLYRLPIPTWTAGEDPAPYITAGTFLSKDPETGIRNASNYRLQLKGKNKLGCLALPFHDGGVHILKNNKLGRPTQVAVVIGSDPAIGLAAVADVPYGVDELAVAGGLRGSPLELVRCETVDLEVPASAEIVIEGEVPANYREPEGPFGEYTGYMSGGGETYVLNVTCITHRSNPFFHVFMSQFPPSEGSCIRRIGLELTLLKKLKDLGLPITDVHYKESVGSHAYLVISIKKTHDAQPQQVMWGAWCAHPLLGKITVIVDDDIDIRNSDEVDWALSYRMQPDQDLHVVRNCQPVNLDPSAIPYTDPRGGPPRKIASKVGIDATKKFPYPARSVPPREHLEIVSRRWQEYGF